MADFGEPPIVVNCFYHEQVKKLARGTATCGAKAGGCPHKREKPDTGQRQRSGLCERGAGAGGQTVRRRAKWLFRDVMRPRLDSRLISAESALRSTQR